MSTPENSPTFRAAILAALLAHHYPLATPHRIASVVHDMQNAARIARGWETRRCNEPMTEAQEEAGSRRLETAQTRINEDLQALASQEGMISPARVVLGGDPRGPCATLLVPGQTGDGYGPGFSIF